MNIYYLRHISSGTALRLMISGNIPDYYLVGYEEITEQDWVDVISIATV